jgi:hypothetical protein
LVTQLASSRPRNPRTIECERALDFNVIPTNVRFISAERNPVIVGAADTDGDGLSDPFGSCPLRPSLDQADFDADGIGDICTCGNGVFEAAVEEWEDGTPLSVEAIPRAAWRSSRGSSAARPRAEPSTS